MRSLAPYQSIWSGAAPTTNVIGVGQFLLRTTCYFTNPGQLLGLQFYESSEDNINHIGVVVQRNTGTTSRAALRALSFPHYSPGNVPTFGWQRKYFGSPLDVVANDWLDIVVWYTGGHYWYTPSLLASGGRITSGQIVVPTDGASDPGGNTLNNSAIAHAVTFNPNDSLSGALAGIDVIWLPG